MQQYVNVPYVSADEFNKKVDEYARENWILKSLFSNPNSGIKTWEDLPAHLRSDLFKRLGCKPNIKKY
jgi:hypothetical protein